jgi:hypothetical protein
MRRGCSVLTSVCKPPSLAKMPFSTAKHECSLFLKPIYIGSLLFTCPYGGVLGEKFHPAISPDVMRKTLLFFSRTFPRGEGGMFQAFVLFSSPRSRRPLAWRRASGSYVMGG